MALAWCKRSVGSKVTVLPYAGRRLASGRVPVDRTSRVNAGRRRLRAVPSVHSITSRGPLAERSELRAHSRVLDRPLRSLRSAP
jgi:hypothetical protein